MSCDVYWEVRFSYEATSNSNEGESSNLKRKVENAVEYSCTLCECCCDWFIKEAGWPIAKQSKVRRESQTEDAGKERAEAGLSERSKMGMSY